MTIAHITSSAEPEWETEPSSSEPLSPINGDFPLENESGYGEYENASEEEADWYEDDDNLIATIVTQILPDDLPLPAYLIPMLNRDYNFYSSPRTEPVFCSACKSPEASVHYYCTTCPGGSYRVCSGCADKGLSCLNQDHSLTKRVFDPKSGNFVSEGSYTCARGLRVFVNGQLVSGVGDTGSKHTIISEERCREMGQEATADVRRITLGNGRKMLSTGTVKLSIAFPDSPDQITTVIARVVKNFYFDILLGNPFLQATQTMQKYLPPPLHALSFLNEKSVVFLPRRRDSPTLQR